MINERIALIMLEGEVPSAKEPDPHHRKQLYKSMQSFADASLKLCECGKVKKFEEYLNVALKLFNDGNAVIKNAVINVYLFEVSYALDENQELRAFVQRLFPKELTREYHQFHYSSGM